MTSFKRWFGAGAIVLVALALVACPAMVPEPVGKITPMTITVGDDPQTISDVDDLFTNDDRATYTAKSDNEGVATASISGTTLTVTPVSAGSATVTITATLNNGKTATTSFMVTVKAAPVTPPDPPPDPDNNQPRLVADELPDVDDLKVGLPQTIELAPLFIDDEDDVVSFAAQSTAPGTVMASATLTGTLTLTAVSVGTATIHVYAADGQHFDGQTPVPVRESFSVTVVNQAPMAVTEGLSFRIGLRPGETDSRDLTPYFMDAEGDALTYSASVAPDSVGTASVTGTMLTITAVAVGDAMVTVTANDGTDDGTTEFTLQVSDEPNNPPDPVGTIDAKTLEMDFDETDTFDVAEYFNDPDDDMLTYTASSDMEDYVMASADGSMVTIEAVADGMATITVTASDGRGGSANQMFGVTVVLPAKPTRGSDIGRHEFGSDDRDPRDIILMDHFNNATRYEAMSDDTGVVTAEVDEAHTKVTLTPIGAGTAEVTITPRNSGGAGPSQSFTVEVEAAPMAPALKDDMTFSDIVLLTPRNAADDADNPAASTMKVFEDLNTYFEDPDKTFGTKALTFSTTADDDAKVVTVKEEGATKNKVTLTAKAAGTATITITATDGDGLSSMPASFMVTVATDNSTPTAENATAAHDATGGIADVDGDPLVGPDGSTTVFGRIPVGETRDVINDKRIVDYFDDPDMNRGARGDTLTFTVKYYRWGTGDAATGQIDAVDDIIDSTTNLLHASDATEYRAPLASDKAQVSATFSTTEWSGSHSSKFTLSLTGERSSTAETPGGDAVAIIATDEYGLSAARVFQVRTNQAPKAQGPQEKDPKVLSDADTFHDLQVGGAAVTLALVDNSTPTSPDGYFSDEDGIGDLFNTGAVCRADLSIALADAKSPLSAFGITRTGDTITLSATPHATVTGTMYADIKCSDGIAFSEPVRIRLTTVASTSGSGR